MMALCLSVGTHKEEQLASALKRLDLAVEAHGRWEFLFGKKEGLNFFFLFYFFLIRIGSSMIDLLSLFRIIWKPIYRYIHLPVI